MARTSSSEKRIVIPSRETMKMSSLPVVWTTLTSSSSSRRLMAMRPVRSEESYSLISVFFTTPLAVPKNR